MSTIDSPIYDALVVPDEALANGGIEILRAGVIDDELFVTARRAFVDPAQWGEVLADIAQRLAILYSLETDLSEQEVLAAIESAFAAELGAPVIKPPRRKPARKATKSAKTTKAAKAKRAKTTKPARAKSSRAKPRGKRT